MAVVIIPAMLFQSFDSRLLNKVHSKPFLGIASAEKNKLDIESRLEIICGYGTNKNIVLTDKGETGTQQEYKNAEDVVLCELKAMQAVGAFPQMTLDSDKKLIYARTQTFTDMSSAGSYVKVNIFSFSSGNSEIQVMTDSETNHIYQYEVGSRNEFVEQDLSNIPSNFANYLGIQLNEVTNSEDNIVTYSTENQKINYLIAISHDFIALQLMFGLA